MALMVVPYNSFHKSAACPYCGREHVKRYATSTDYERGIRFRYHRCESCYETFKSIQLDVAKHQDMVTVLSEVLTGDSAAYRRENIAM